MQSTPRYMYLATGNAHKVDEIRAMVGPKGFTVLGAPAGFAVNEDGTTFAQNAAKKAWALHAQLISKGQTPAEFWVLADDSGLAVDALQGAPGVQSARYADAADDQDAANRSKLLAAMAHVPPHLRSARFVCALALIDSTGTLTTYAGEVPGHITTLEQGDGGFGYDALFVPKGEHITFAQSPSATKQALSHRGRAVRQMLAAL
jgi:XTP/dITP diphosphohydrolase